MWVVAHECGHRAFSDNLRLQTAVGYVFHTVLMVPYFSWQRSHAVHHARTNHLSEGETHVPYAVTDDPELYAIGAKKLAIRQEWLSGNFGAIKFGMKRLWSHLVFGWPAYIIGGATGGPVRGNTSHFDPTKGTQGRNALFPGKFAEKVCTQPVALLNGGCFAIEINVDAFQFVRAPVASTNSMLHTTEDS